MHILANRGQKTYFYHYTYLAKSIQKCMSISTMIMTQHKIASEHKYQPMQLAL